MSALYCTPKKAQRCVTPLEAGAGAGAGEEARGELVRNG